MRQEEVASTYAEWGEPVPGGQAEESLANRVEPPCSKEAWMSYMSGWIENMWYGMRGQLDEHGVPLLEACSLADFAEFCYQWSDVRPMSYYSTLMRRADDGDV